MTVAQNVAFGLKIKKVPKAETAGRVEEALCTVRMEDATPIGARPIFRAGSSSASRWLERSSTGRRRCCSTNRSARST